MIKINKELYRDKVHACWIGKNIGGTMGTPYEGKTQLQDIKGFVTPKGTILPNDDLDLQLVWLLAMEQHGPYSMSSQILSEYWISYIPPHWNEYGVGKCNLKAGMLPPLSGEYENDKWKNSNGAWIRSEVWACMAPGFPDIAIQYAFMDASVDHGISEGTYAEVFTATLESAAFFESDIRKLINIAFSKIPSDCRVSRSVKLVLESYDNGLDWQTTRNLLVKDSEDLGWFQAPANIGYTVLGLIYGEGDFKKSMIYAINCGDDTDCTGATVGALLGIINGTKGIPTDWSDHIGDGIKTVAVDASCTRLAKSCTELTDRILSLMPVVFKANGMDFEFTDGESDLSDTTGLTVPSTISQDLFNRSPYSYDVPDFIYAKARVEFENAPVIKPNQSINATIRLFNTMPDPRYLTFKIHLPEGWSADNYKRSLYMDHQRPQGETWSVTINAGENVEAINRVIVEISATARPSLGLIPLIIIG